MVRRPDMGVTVKWAAKQHQNAKIRNKTMSKRHGGTILT